MLCQCTSLYSFGKILKNYKNHENCQTIWIDKPRNETRKRSNRGPGRERIRFPICFSLRGSERVQLLTLSLIRLKWRARFLGANERSMNKTIPVRCLHHGEEDGQLQPLLCFQLTAFCFSVAAAFLQMHIWNLPSDGNNETFFLRRPLQCAGSNLRLPHPTFGYFRWFFPHFELGDPPTERRRTDFLCT